MEKLTAEQIARLKASSHKQFLEYANYYYVHDLQYYKEFFEPYITADKNREKANKKTAYILIGSIIGLLFFLLVIVLFINVISGDKKTVTKQIEKTVYNGDRTTTIYKCERYLMSRLHDPKSYEPVNWSDVIKTESGLYKISHTYRAKNKMGALSLGTTTFLLNEEGTVISATDD